MPVLFSPSVPPKTLIPLRPPRAYSDTLPAVRSYDAPLASLSLLAAASLSQSLTAAASDPSLSSNTTDPTISLLTAIPGPHATVSTRLFLPTPEVKQKARKMRRSMTKDILSTAVPDNVLALTSRQVVMRSLISFQLSLFAAGSERDMDHLDRDSDTDTYFNVSSSEDRLLAALAEVVFTCALESAVRRGGVFEWFGKERGIFSKDGSICLSRIAEREVVESARKQVQRFREMGTLGSRKRRGKDRLWAAPSYGRLEREGGREFSEWANEFVPAYRMWIDGGVYKDLKLDGWRKLDGGRSEVLLTHYQMVELANILDVYYEDQYTIPDKQLSCGLITETSNKSKNKFSSWKMLFVTVAGGCILVSVSVLAQVCFPQLLKAGRASKQSSLLSSFGADCCLLQSPEDTKMEALCTSVVRTVKDSLSWPGNIMFDTSIGAWTGVLPSYLTDKDSIAENATSNTSSPVNLVGKGQQRDGKLFVERAPVGTNKMDLPADAQNIASYQVVLSGDGKIVGFQPTSRVAVNHWASNPLAKVLYEGQKLSPSLLEPSLKIPRPREVVLLELLMSLNPDSYFALARAHNS